MDYDDVPGFIQALRQRQSNSVAAVALEFLLITAARSGEVRGMLWPEVKFEDRLWIIPKERTKTGREHRVPLSDRAMEILKRQQERGADHYVFFAHQRHHKPLDEKSMRDLLRKMRIKATVHGFRSSFKDWAEDTTGFPSARIEECLAHRIGNKAEQAYRRKDALKKRHEIMSAWAAHCDSHSADLTANSARIGAGQR
jgi:integrase